VSQRLLNDHPSPVEFARLPHANYRAERAWEVPMPGITLKARYDGQSILLDEPSEPSPEARRLVTVVAPSPGAEREMWARLGGEGLARACGDDGPDCGPDEVRRP
jgi:hypothetical protein